MTGTQRSHKHAFTCEYLVGHDSLGPLQVQLDRCFELTGLRYAFVAAFENDLCEDYVSEKLFNALNLVSLLHECLIGCITGNPCTTPTAYSAVTVYSPKCIYSLIHFPDSKLQCRRLTLDIHNKFLT